MARAVFYVSDSTALTAKALGQSLLSQFENLQVHEFLRPYINTKERVESLVSEINDHDQNHEAAIVFASMMDDELMEHLRAHISGLVDIFRPFNEILEKLIPEKSSKAVGQAHRARDQDSYKKRIRALDFAMATDDGLLTSQYEEADLILLGVSRTGKTPTALYLALNFGLKVANFPFTQEDLPKFVLREAHEKNRSKLFGLLISPERLVNIRKERRPGGDYCDPLKVAIELRAMAELFDREGINYVDATTRSVEEIAAFIVDATRKKWTPKK